MSSEQRLVHLRNYVLRINSKVPLIEEILSLGEFSFNCQNLVTC